MITGLLLVDDFINSKEYDHLLEVVETQPWIYDLKRRVQHYGWRYDYKYRDVKYIDKLPSWLSIIAQRMHQEGYFSATPDQVIVNEYMPGQGIAAHIDSKCFDDTIATISLGSSCVMNFTRDGYDPKSILLKPKSLLVLKAESRYLWQHSIANIKTDYINNTRIKRARRISITFRNVVYKT